MSILEKFQIIIPLGLIVSVNFLACWLIGSYIKKKSTGLQTILDKLIIRLIIADALYCIDVSILTYFLVFPVPFLPLVAKIIFYWQSFIFNFFLCWFIIVIVVKYLCIFHSNIMETEFTDHELVNKISIYTILILASFFGMEHAFYAKIEYFTVYQFLSGQIPEDGKQGLTKLSLILHCLSIASVSFTQFQIERKGLKNISSAIKLPEINAETTRNNTEENANSKCSGGKERKWVFRFATILTISGAIYTMNTLFDLDFSSDQLNLLLKGSILVTFYCIIPPLLYIIKTENLKMYATNCIKNRKL